MASTNYVNSIGRQILSPQGAVALLGWLGARRQRRSSPVGWIAGVAVVGAGAALLFGTSRGQALRSRLGGALGSGIGDLVGGVAGAHPVKTAQLVDKVKDTFATRANS